MNRDKNKEFRKNKTTERKNKLSNMNSKFKNENNIKNQDQL